MYTVNLSKYVATEDYMSKNKAMKHTYVLFIDHEGLFILKREGKVYLDYNNSKFI